MQFRFKALAKLREPDELDAPAVLTAPRSWLLLACVAAVMTATAAWAVFGRLPQTVSASGLIAYPYGMGQVQSLYSGMVTKVLASTGGQVVAGQDLAVVQDARGNRHRVVSLFTGQVASVQAGEGEVIGAGTTVATVERSLPGDPVALLFVSPGQAAGVAPGQDVGLAVASAPAAAFGLLRGQVVSVSRFPLTQAQESVLIGSDAAAKTLAADGGKLLVTVRLRQDSRTVTGYAWTMPGGPPQPLPPLVPAAGTITLGSQTPISLLFSP